MRILLFAILLSFTLPYHSQEVELVTQEKVLGVINDIKYSPNGKYVASTNSRDNYIMIWDVRSAKLIGKLIGHQKPITKFFFNPVKDEIVSLDEDNLCYYWNLNTWNKYDSSKLSYGQEIVSFDPSGEFLLSFKSNQLISLKGTEENTIYKSKGGINAISSIASDKNLIWLATSKGAVLLDYKKGSEIQEIKVNSQYSLKSIHGTKEKVAFVTTIKGEVFVVNENGSVTKEFSGVKDPIGLDASAYVARLAMIDQDGSVKVYDKEGQLISTLKDEESGEKTKVISFSYQGESIAAAGYKTLLLDKIYSKNNVIQIWNVKRENMIKLLKGNVNPIDAFAFSPADNFLYTLRGQQLDIWSLNSAQRLGTYLFPERKLEIKDRGKDNVVQKTEETKEDIKDKASNTTITANKVNKWKQMATGDFSSIKDDAKNKIDEKTTAAKTYAKEESKLAGKAAFRRFGFQEDQIIISPKGNYMLTVFKNDEVRLYSLENGLPTYIDYVKTGQKEFYDIIFDHEEKYIAVGGSGMTPLSIIYIEDIQKTTDKQLEVTETEDLKMNGMFQAANAITLSNDGNYLVAAFNTGRIVAWRTNSWYRVLDFNMRLTMSRKPFIGFSEKGDKLFVNTGLGIYSYDFTTVMGSSSNSEETLSNITGIKKAKVSGFPVMTHRPLDHVIAIDDNNINFMDIIDDKINQTHPIPCNLVTDVQVNKFGYVGVSSKDGSLTIFDPETGKERFVMVGENENAIFKTPDQYYKITKEGQDLVTFKVGSEAYPFEQFDAKFNRPDIVLKAMNSEDHELLELYKMAHQKRLKKLGLNENDLGNISTLPIVTINDLETLPLTTEKRQVTFHITADAKNGSLGRLKVWNNDVPIYGIQGKEISGTSLNETISVQLTSGKNKIQVAVSGKNGLESLKETIEVYCTDEAKPNLYLVTIGTSQYKDSRYNLNYAAKDAKDLAKIFETNKGIYGQVFTKTITDKESTIENIKNLKEFFDNAKIDDVVMVFVAGHGLLDVNYDYYYGTHNVNFNKPSEHGLAYNLLEALLDNIAPLKRILIMDTCHSGEVEEEEILVSNDEVDENEDVMFRSVGPALSTIEASPSKMMKELFTDLRRGTGATVLSSAGGAEFAMESSEWKNGLFTYSLLFGLRNGSADLNEDGQIMLSELQIYVSDMVTKLSHGKQTPTARIQNQELDYPIW
ncbi:MAG: caspase family protein [Flavobacteriales bacterium]|nr:caspase family protein [Flavobacteriales bacterium]